MILIKDLELERRRAGLNKPPRLRRMADTRPNQDTENDDSHLSNFKLCRRLAALEEGFSCFIPRTEHWRELWYRVACLQEEFIISGSEDVFRDEMYISSSQREIFLFTSSQPFSGSFNVSRFQRRWCWEKKHMHFPTLSEAYIVGGQVPYWNCFSSSRGLQKKQKLFCQELQRIFTDENSAPVKSGHQLKSIHDLVQNEGRKASRKIARRVDAWLLRNFVYSAATRRMLYSGYVKTYEHNTGALRSDQPFPQQYLPRIDINERSFGRFIVSEWSDVERFGKIKSCSSVRVQMDNGMLRCESDSDMSTIQPDWQDGVNYEFTDTTGSEIASD